MSNETPVEEYHLRHTFSVKEGYRKREKKKKEREIEVSWFFKKCPNGGR